MRKLDPQTGPASAKPIHLLIVEDNAADLELTARELRKSGMAFEFDAVATREELHAKLKENHFDVILTDYRMPGWTGLDALALTRQHGIDAPLILLTGTLGEELAVECIRRGVTDYILKHQLPRLPLAIRNALEEKALREQRARSEQSLRQSEASFRLMFAANPLPMWVFDRETRKFLEVNDAAVNHYGFSREEFLRMTITEIRSEQEAHRLADFLSSGHEGGEAGIWRHRTKGGRNIDVQILWHPLDFGGRPGVLVIAEDVTEQRCAERALRDSERRYRSVFENAPYAISRVTVDGQILDANPSLLAMLGYMEVEGLSTNSIDGIFGNPAERRRFVDEIRTHGRSEGEFEWKRTDGSFITVRASGKLGKDERDASEYLEIIAEDVTERRALTKQLQQAQKFEAIGQLAGGIAHDFNNMIGAIIGWAELGLEEAENGTRLHRNFEKVRQQADRAAALTRQLLAFARKQILEPRDIDLNQIVVETLSLLEKVIGSNIDIQATLAPDLSIVRADPTQIEQVLMNLCLNSRDAMPNGGTLSIETKNRRLDEEYCRAHTQAHPGDYALLKVTDTGEGMDGATLDRIFEPFFTTKGTGKGTGLGLATVYGIVKQHCGFVCVGSVVGNGTTFEVFLPISASVVIAAPQKEEDSQAQGGQETILVAEDHEGLREIAHETLTHLGYKVMLAKDGEQAIEKFRDHRDQIHLVLLDVVLPKLSGPEAYSRMCVEVPGVPVVFATGYSSDHALLGEMGSMGIPVLQKPYTPRDLARKVRETLDRAKST